MARPLKPLIRGGGYYPSKRWTPLVYNGGYTTMNGGEEPTPVNWKTITGVSPLALANALAEHIRSLTQFGKCVQNGTPTPSTPAEIMCNNGAIKARHESGLPTGCNLLDYVRNASSTRVDTGIYDDVDDFRIELRVSPSGGSWYIVQSRASTSAPIYGMSGANSGSKISFGNGLSAASVSSDIARDTSHTYTIIGEHKNGNISLYVKDETTGEEDTQTNTYRTSSFVAATSPFGVWGTASNTVNLGNDIYYLRIYKGGVLVADYMPCESGGENGFYDFVTEAFIGKTAGTINAGSPVTDPIVIVADGTPEVLTVSADGAETQTVNDVPMLLSVGDAKDEAEIISGIKTGRVGIYVFTGEETFGTSTTYGTCVLFNKAYHKWDADSNCTPFCTHFVGLSRVSSGQQTVGTCFFNSSSHFYFSVEDNDTTAFKAFLAAQYANGTPVIVLYRLATETTEQGTAHTLNSYEGTTVVGADTNVDPVTLSVEYASSEEE